jgi:type II secretory pathway pseudopilin PulG
MLERLRIRYDHGDTLIEVLFAITIFSMVVVAALAIMNQGANTSQRALEVTIVRQEIDAQAAALRFMHDSYVSLYQPNATAATYGTAVADTPAREWFLMNQNITLTNNTDVSAFGIANNTCPTPPTGSFIINTQAAAFVPPVQGAIQPVTTTGYSKVVYSNSGGNTVVSSAQGIWIEAVRSAASGDPNQANTGYVDFHIRACWDSVASTVPVTLGTIVRLYEPRG